MRCFRHHLFARFLPMNDFQSTVDGNMYPETAELVDRFCYLSLNQPLSITFLSSACAHSIHVLLRSRLQPSIANYTSLIWGETNTWHLTYMNGGCHICIVRCGWKPKTPGWKPNLRFPLLEVRTGAVWFCTVRPGMSIDQSGPLSFSKGWGLTWRKLVQLWHVWSKEIALNKKHQTKMNTSSTYVA